MDLWHMVRTHRISRPGSVLSVMALGLGILCGCSGGSSAKVLYAVGLLSNNVSIFQVSGSGALSASAADTVSTGSAPNVIAVDPMGRFAYVLNSACSAVDRSTCANPGSVSQYMVRGGNGSLTVATFSSTTGTITSTPVPTGVNSSAMVIDSTGTFVFVANRGLNPPTPQNPPSLSVFTIDSVGGTLTEVKQVQPPCTPNQFSICPLPIPAPPGALATSGKMLFVAMAGSLATYTFDSTTGFLKTPAAFATPLSANPTAMVLDRSGKFLFVVDSVANTVAVFSVANSGEVMPVGSPLNIGAGKTPASVNVSPSGNFLFIADQGSNEVSTFSIDSSGALTKLSDTPVSPGAAPSYVTTDASGGFLFVANRDSNNISSFSIDSKGALKEVTGSGSLFVNRPVALASGH